MVAKSVLRWNAYSQTPTCRSKVERVRKENEIEVAKEGHWASSTSLWSKGERIGGTTKKSELTGGKFHIPKFS